MFALVEISGWFKAAIRAFAILLRGCRTASRPVLPVTFNGTRADAIRFDRTPFG
jgi:hypothetical protein